MEKDEEYTLHRKRVEANEDKMITRGSKDEVLRLYLRMPRAQQKECAMMLGGMEWNFHEIDNMVQDKESVAEIEPAAFSRPLDE